MRQIWGSAFSLCRKGTLSDFSETCYIQCSLVKSSLCSSLTPLTFSIAEMHGKPTHGHNVRGQHSLRWWMQSKTHHLTALPHIDEPSCPHFPAYNEDVDKPMIVPEDACCFNCSKPIDQSDLYSYVWVPAGNARLPSAQGYFFHYKCFKCWNCKMRLIHNIFYSKDNKAWCLSCALGHQFKYPPRRWHTSYVNGHRFDSRQSGQFFPRHRHQMEFLFNTDEEEKDEEH